MIWTFDDYHIGRAPAIGNVVRERLIERPSRISKMAWYRLAGDVCRKLNELQKALDDERT